MMYKPTVGIFSSPNSLSVYIAKKLLEKNCKVLIFSDSENTEKILDYAVFVSLNRQTTPEDFIRKYINVYSKETKCLFVFNYSHLSQLELGKYLPPNVGVVYVGDILGDDSKIDDLIKLAYGNKIIKVSQDEVLYPLYKEDVGNIITRWIFSFGPYGEEVAILSKDVPITTFLSSIKKYFPGFKIEISRPARGLIRRKIKKFLVNPDFDLYLSQLKPKSKNISYSPSKSFRSRIFVFPLLTTLSTLIISPIFFLGTSILILFLAKRSLIGGNLLSAQRLLWASKIPAEIAHKETSLFIKIPVLDLAYRPIFFFSETVSEISSIGNRIIKITGSASELLSKTLGEEVFGPDSYSEDLSLELDLLYKDLAFLQSDLGNATKNDKVINWLTKEIPIESSKSLVLEARNIAKEIPEILGAGKKKTYLVLFQNNMELRPTGGFIGSFALITFDGGRLKDINVQDVYSADGQLKGHVEPPKPIKDYLGEEGWYLRDANWDTDFPTSAKKIEWFLDKEIDKTVDGVIAIDLEFIKSLLSEIGPLNLSDFNTQVDSQNLYEKTQAEVESEFFPGSYKKTNFLTALSSALLNKVTNLAPKERFEIIKATFNGLERRHVQIFLHNKVAQGAIDNLGWSGRAPSPTCPGNCLADWFGIVEANVGVNKANYFVQREQKLSSELSAGQVTHTLMVNYQNNANTTLGEKGKYKSYLRVAIPKDGIFQEIKVGVGENIEKVLFDEETISGRKEAGVLIEILPQQKKSVQIIWTQANKLNYQSSGEYRLLWRKQAGTINDSARVDIKLPGGINYSFSPEAILTQDGSVSYNTNLARDFISRIYWK